MADALAGSGQLFNEIPMSALYAGANLVRDYAVPMYNKGREIAQTAIKDSKLAELYNRKDQSGQQVMPKEEDLLNVYSSVGDEEGMKRMQKRIDEREGTYQETQDAIYLKQIENAKANGQYDLIPKILDSRNADSRLVNRTGKFNFDPNLGTFDRPLQAGESVTLPDGSKITGDNIGGIKVKLGKDAAGQYRPVGVDTKDRDDYLKLYAAQQKASNKSASGAPLRPLSYEGLAKHGGVVGSVQQLDENIMPLLQEGKLDDLRTMFFQVRDSNAKTSYQNAAEAIIRGESGAAVPDSEIKRLSGRYMPMPQDSDETVKKKIETLYSRANQLANATRSIYNTGEGDNPYIGAYYQQQKQPVAKETNQPTVTKKELPSQVTGKDGNVYVLNPQTGKYRLLQQTNAQ